MVKGKIVVISGPSGVGKTTLYKRLLNDFKDRLCFSISATTRTPRKTEKEGIDYYFISKENFKERIKKGEFVEWATVHGNLYGTLKSEIDRIISSCRNCLLDVDVQGGMNIKKSFPEAILVYIAPPSIDELRNRIIKRNTDNPKSIQVRMEDAMAELEYAEKYDFPIINENIEKAYLDLKEIVRGIIS